MMVMMIVVTIIVAMMVVVLMVVVVVMMVLVVVMMMMVVMVMTLMIGDGAICGDVVGDDDDRGRGVLNWGTCKCLTVWVQASFISAKFPLNLQTYAVLPCGAICWIFHPRGIRVNGNDTCI